MLLPASKLRCILVTIDTHERALQLIQTSLSERLAYFGIISPAVYTMLGWHGSVRESKEHTVLLLTSVETQESLVNRINELHPSDNPVILAWELSAVSPTLATIVTSQWEEPL